MACYRGSLEGNRWVTQCLLHLLTRDQTLHLTANIRHLKLFTYFLLCTGFGSAWAALVSSCWSTCKNSGLALQSPCAKWHVLDLLGRLMLDMSACCGVTHVDESGIRYSNGRLSYHSDTSYAQHSPNNVQEYDSSMLPDGRWKPHLTSSLKTPHHALKTIVVSSSLGQISCVWIMSTKLRI
jgi:hypothetical protein